MEIKELMDGSELLVDNSNELPIIIKNKLLLSPGVWNGVKYTADEIKDAYKNTEWHNKSNRQLYLDHQDTKEAGTGNYVGFIENPQIIGDELRGDLSIWNPLIAMYLTKAKAKFGISATLKGMEDKDTGKMKDFHFESFSIVTKPACKPAYINLSQAEGSKIITPAVYEDYNQEKSQGGKMEEVKKLQEDSKIDEDKKDVKDSKKKEEPKEEEQAKKKEEESNPKDEKCAKKKEDEDISDEDEHPHEDEMSDNEFISITTNSSWTDFVGKMKGKYPKMSFKDIAKAYKEKSQSQNELEARSDDELVESLHQIIAVLKRRKAYPGEPKKDEDSELSAIKKELSEIKQKMNEGDSKTVNLSANAGPKQSPTSGMADFVSDFVGKGSNASFTLE